MSAYEASWKTQSDEARETPMDERFGDGVGFEQKPAQTDEVDAGDEDGEEVSIPAETPAWVDDAMAVTRRDLIPEELPGGICPDCINRPSRAVYQLVQVPHTSAFFQLMKRHGMKFAGHTEDGKRVWVAKTGLDVLIDGDVGEEGNLDVPYVSYITVKGPADEVVDFVEDLFELATYIKRELRAPALIEDANEAQRDGTRVPEANRLVDWDEAAGIVARLPSAGADEGVRGEQ